MLKQLKFDVCSAAIDAIAAVPPSGTFGYGAFVHIATSLFRVAAAKTSSLAGNYLRNYANHRRA